MSYHHPETKAICAKAYLDYVRSLNLKIQTMREDIEKQKALMLPSGIEYCEAVSKSTANDNMENGIIKLNDMIAEYCTELAEFVEQQRIAKRVFDKLSQPRACAAFSKYYLQCKTWEQVCVDVGYSWQGMMKLRKNSIAEIYDAMPEEWRRYSIPNAQPL